MKTLGKAGKIFRFLMATIGSTLFDKKPPKPPQKANSVAELEAYVNTLVNMSRPPGLSLAFVKNGFDRTPSCKPGLGMTRYGVYIMLKEVITKVYFGCGLTV